jgi:2-dehydro-3-deoxyglucarate aldolase/4-hydroxy-2-oxoheptanedioate aldolase
MTRGPVDLAHRVAAGETLFGTFVFEFGVRGIAAIAAGAGADFVVFDAEHTGWGWERLAGLVAAARTAGTAAIVRVPDLAASGIARALDIGAHGVMVPMVESAAQAADAVAAALYPPAGRRGLVVGLGADDYRPTDPAAAIARRNHETVVIAQIETVDGLAACEQIAAVDGISALWLGHLDLTTSMRIPGQFDDPRYLSAVDRIAAAADAHGRAAGFADLDASLTQAMLARGYRLIAVGTDVALYRDALASRITAARAAGARPADAQATQTGATPTTSTGTGTMSEQGSVR